MKKKILAFILAAAMLLSLSACAKDTPQNPGTEANAAPALPNLILGITISL